jgi:hypothetical protein
MGHRFSATDKEKLKYWQKSLSVCHFTHYKIHWDCLGLKQGLCNEKPSTDHPSYGTTPVI